MKWLSYLKIGGLATLIAALGVQTHRLDNAQERIAVLEARETAQKREKAQRDMQNVRNTERANEDNAAGRKRAATVIVRDEPIGGITNKKVDAGSGDKPTGCYDRRDVDEGLAELARWQAQELTRILAGFSRRDAEESTGIARLGEAVANGYRVCINFAKDMQ